MTFDRTTGLTNEEIARYVEFAENNDVLFKKDFWTGYGFRIYQPDGAGVTPANGRPVVKSNWRRGPHEEPVSSQT